jgi:hypothetical protein
MNIKKVINRLVILSLIVTCVALFFRSCQKNHEYSSSVEDLLRDKKGIEKLVDEQGRQSAYLRATILTKDKAIEKQLKEISELKTLDTKIKIANHTQIDTLILELHDTTLITSTDTIKYQKFSHSEKWFALGGKIQDKQLII